MKIIDLSFHFKQGFSVVPGHPEVSMKPITTHKDDGKSNTYFCTSTHAGTHIDPPYHFLPDHLTIDDLPLERFFRRGIKLDLSHLGEPGSEITSNELEKASQIVKEPFKGKIVLLHTGWSKKMYHLSSYYGDNPHLTLDGCDWLVHHKVNIVGLDTPPPQKKVGQEHSWKKTSADIHLSLLKGDVLIAENLVNLDLLPISGFHIAAFPIKLYRGDGAPARVVAICD